MALTYKNNIKMVQSKILDNYGYFPVAFIDNPETLLSTKAYDILCNTNYKLAEGLELDYNYYLIDVGEYYYIENNTVITCGTIEEINNFLIEMEV